MQLQRAAPERRLEDVVNVLALALFSGLDQQPGPFQWKQDARGESSHFVPSGVVPVMFLAVERREQRPLGGAMVGLDVEHVYPDIPFPKGALFKTGVGGMVDLENEKGDKFSKQQRWCLRQFSTTLGQPEFTFEVPPQAQGDKDVIQNFERRELIFVDDLVVAEHFLRA